MKKHILVVDDSESSLELIEMLLEPKFSVTTLSNSEQCLEKVFEVKPDLILLDIVMPELDGYTLCQMLKSSDETAFIPVMFLSALNQVSDRVEGYACGAEDYITKPVEPEEFVEKVETTLKNYARQREWEDHYQESKNQQEIARSALDELYEMGALMNFHRKCGQCVEVEELGNEILRICRTLGLDANVQLNTHQGMQYFGCRYRSLEAKLLHETFESNKTLQTRSRSVVHGKHVSVLVKNLSQDDESQHERYQENLQVLVNSASNRLEIIDLELSEREALSKSMRHLENTIFLIEKSLSSHNRTVKTKLLELLEEARQYTEALEASDEIKPKLQTSIEKSIAETGNIDNMTEMSSFLNKMVREFQNE